MSARAVTWVVGAAVIAAALAMLAIVGAGWSPSVPYVLALAVVAAVVAVAIRRVFLTVQPPTWPLLEPRTVDAAVIDPRVATIGAALRRGVEDADACRRRVQPLLFDLATHRLRRNRDIAIVEQPEEARGALGDEVFRFLTEVVDDPVPPALLARTIAAIERL